MVALHWIAISFLLMISSYVTQQTEDARFNAFLMGPDGYNKRYEAVRYLNSVAAWAFNTNITDYNRQVMTNMSLLLSEFNKMEAVTAEQFNVSAMTDNSLKRQLKYILDVGISGYNETETLRRIADLRANMTGIYSSAQWCKTPNDCKALEPGLTDLIANSRNYTELLEAWKGWRDVSGKNMRPQYQEFVQLMNKAIKAGGQYADMGDYYRSWYEQPTFETDVRDLFDAISPLYKQLHAYVRRKLKIKYGADKFPTSGHIPAHVLGDMWSQSWTNMYDLLEPYPGMGRINLTESMIKQNYTVTRMYVVAEEFFQSIGMGPMPESFWNNSMLERPEGREVVCHPSAWDFNNGTDFRIKQCTKVTQEQMITVHHEMGHIQYYMEYKPQPVRFRTGANPGFHEGVADIVSLSFQTPEHLLKIGLIDELPTGNQSDINFLLQMALDKVAFLPFGYLVDQWRWSVYRGHTTPDKYNADWWDLRCKYQGISPPVTRSEADFDPGAKFHIAANIPYIRYFVSTVAQFQWHKALCELIGKDKPLHRCDIYRNETAGARLQEMLQMGSSQPWGEAMRTITRGTSGETDKLNASALLEYFKPLQTWLTDENKAACENVGWTTSTCPDLTTHNY